MGVLNTNCSNIVVFNYLCRMPRPLGYPVHDLCWKVIRASWEQTVTCVYRLIHRAVMNHADEELGTIDNLSRSQLEVEGRATVLRGFRERERIGGFEQTEDKLEDTSVDTTASADTDVTSSAFSLVVTSAADTVHHAGRKSG